MNLKNLVLNIVRVILSMTIKSEHLDFDNLLL